MARSTDEAVNPRHYASFGQFSAVLIARNWNRIRSAMGAKPITHNVFNALKYIQRAGLKEGQDEVRDLEKAIWYLQNDVHELDGDKPDPTEGQ